MATKTEAPADESKVITARNKNLDLAIQQIAKDFGRWSHHAPGRKPEDGCGVDPHGNILIDRALGTGGFPRGRISRGFRPGDPPERPRSP
jgi:recombination protein RecA